MVYTSIIWCKYWEIAMNLIWFQVFYGPSINSRLSHVCFMCKSGAISPCFRTQIIMDGCKVATWCHWSVSVIIESVTLIEPKALCLSFLIIKLFKSNQNKILLNTNIFIWTIWNAFFVTCVVLLSFMPKVYQHTFLQHLQIASSSIPRKLKKIVIQSIYWK